MTNDQIIALWRKHQEVIGFSRELLNIQRMRCANIADDEECKHKLVRKDGSWQWISPAAEAIRSMPDEMPLFNDWGSIPYDPSKCPPCNHKCEQGRLCPTLTKKS